METFGIGFGEDIHKLEMFTYKENWYFIIFIYNNIKLFFCESYGFVQIVFLAT